MVPLVSVPQSWLDDFDRDYQSYVQTATSNSSKSAETQAPVSDYRKSKALIVPCNTDDIVRLFDYKKKKTKDLCKEGCDTLVLDWYLRLIDPPESYLRHLDYFREHDKDGNFSEYMAGGEIRGYYFYKHKQEEEEEEETWSALPDVDCDPFNPCSKFKSIRSSASRTYSQLRNLDGCKNILFLELTFPEEISEQLLGSNQSRVIEKANSCVNRFMESLSKRLEFHVNEYKPLVKHQLIPADATYGGQYNPHIWKTQEPTKPHLHAHLDLLWAYYDGEELHPLKFHDKGKPLDADFVRSLWMYVVSEVFGYDYEDKDGDVHVAWAPLSWRTKNLHRLKYRRRKPITDLAEYYLDHDFDPDDFDDGFNKFCLDYVNRSHSFGFWTFLAKLQKDAKNSANTKTCPVCGKKVVSEVFVPFSEGIFDRVVFQKRDGTFETTKPPPETEKNSGGDQYE